MIVVDAMGKACPMPVIMAKKEMEKGSEAFVVLVDNKIAVENLKRLANSQNFFVEIKGEENNFQVFFTKECEQCEELLEQYEKEQRNNVSNDYTVFIGKDYIGEGDHTLGRSLIQMFLYTLTESKELPNSILFMNAGVKLPVEDEQCIEHLKTLQQTGVDIVVCGTCLNYFGMAEQLQVGTVSNMFDIVEEMQQAGKVITL